MVCQMDGSSSLAEETPAIIVMDEKSASKRAQSFVLEFVVILLRATSKDMDGLLGSWSNCEQIDLTIGTF